MTKFSHYSSASRIITLMMNFWIVKLMSRETGERRMVMFDIRFPMSETCRFMRCVSHFTRCAGLFARDPCKTMLNADVFTLTGHKNIDISMS